MECPKTIKSSIFEERQSGYSHSAYELKVRGITGIYL